MSSDKCEVISVNSRRDSGLTSVDREAESQANRCGLCTHKNDPAACACGTSFLELSLVHVSLPRPAGRDSRVDRRDRIARTDRTSRRPSTVTRNTSPRSRLSTGLHAESNSRFLASADFCRVHEKRYMHFMVSNIEAGTEIRL